MARSIMMQKGYHGRDDFPSPEACRVEEVNVGVGHSSLNLKNL